MRSICFRRLLFVAGGWRTLLVSVCCLCAMPAVPAEEVAAPPVEAPLPANWKARRPPVESPKPLPPLELLVERLSSPKFLERVQASRDLVRMGSPAVERLVAVAASDQPEASLRATAILEDIWLRSQENEEPETASVAFDALDALSASENPNLQARIDATFAAHEALVARYAMNEVARLGGIVKFEEGVMIFNDSDGSSRPQVQLVLLNKDWKGGETGLRHVQRVRPRQLYLSGDVPLPEGAAERFEVASNIRVERRGQSYLGIRNSNLILPVPGPGPGPGGVQVESVEPGRAADKGGIEAGDIIVEFAGGEVGSFPDLVKQIEKTEPGQTVKVKVSRQGQTLELDVTLEAWTN